MKMLNDDDDDDDDDDFLEWFANEMVHATANFRNTASRNLPCAIKLCGSDNHNTTPQCINK